MTSQTPQDNPQVLARSGDGKLTIGYTTGVFDLFHVGHVRMLKNAKSMCDRLIVGVSTDELVMDYKNKSPVIPFDERLEILSSIKWVDVAVAQRSRDKIDAWRRYKFDYLFVGDDWFHSDEWKETDKKFRKMNINIIYFPYTESTSSTLINETLLKLRNS